MVYNGSYFTRHRLSGTSTGTSDGECVLTGVNGTPREFNGDK